MALRPTYTPQTWVEGSAPALSPANLQVIDDEIDASSKLAGSIPQRFAGLLMRTHPDADKAADQILIESLDYAVMDDGEIIADFSGITIDRTVSGAGGLDTGAIDTVLWYAVHAIYGTSGKSAVITLADRWLTGAEHLVTIGESPTGDVGGSAATTRRAQSFLNESARPIKALSLSMTRVGTLTDGVKITIEADTAGSPSGTALATGYMDPARWPVNSAAQWVLAGSNTQHGATVVFPTAADLAANTTYWIVAERTGAIDAANYVAWNTTAGYADGESKRFDGSSWIATSSDHGFTEWLDMAPELGVTLPTGYTRSCKLGYVRTDGSANLMPFVAADRMQWHMDTTLNIDNYSGRTTGMESQSVNADVFLPPPPLRAFVFSADADASRTHFRIGAGKDGYGALREANEADSAVNMITQRIASTTGASVAQQTGGWMYFAEPVAHVWTNALGAGGTATLQIKAKRWEWFL